MKVPDHIEKKEWGAYCTSCGCGCGERITMSVENDVLCGLTMQFDAKRCVWYQHTRWGRIKDRIGSAFRYFFTGKLEVFSELILDKPEHVRDIASVLNQLADEMEANQKKGT